MIPEGASPEVHADIHIYIYIYIYVCVCVYLEAIYFIDAMHPRSSKHVASTFSYQQFEELTDALTSGVKAAEPTYHLRPITADPAQTVRPRR